MVAHKYTKLYLILITLVFVWLSSVAWFLPVIVFSSYLSWLPNPLIGVVSMFLASSVFAFLPMVYAFRYHSKKVVALIGLIFQVTPIMQFFLTQFIVGLYAR